MEGRAEQKSWETELGRMFDLLHCLTSAQVFHDMSRSMHSADLSFSQITALFTLHRFGPQSIAVLAKGVHLSHAAASRMVEKLVREDLAHRNQDPDNRRRKLVRLSRKGSEFLETLRECTVQAYVELLANAPIRLRDRLWSVLNEIKPYLPPEAGGACQ